MSERFVLRTTKTGKFFIVRQRHDDDVDVWYDAGRVSPWLDSRDAAREWMIARERGAA